MPILWGDCHARKIIFITNSLKISTAQQQVNFDVFLLFQVCNGFVNLVQFTMTATFNSDLHFKGFLIKQQFL